MMGSPWPFAKELIYKLSTKRQWNAFFNHNDSRRNSILPAPPFKKDTWYNPRFSKHSEYMQASQVMWRQLGLGL